MTTDKSHTTQPTAVQVAYPVGRGDRTHHVCYTNNGVANNNVSVPLSRLDVAAWPTGDKAACCRCVPRFRIRNPKDRHPKPGTRLVPQKRKKRSKILHPLGKARSEPPKGPSRRAYGRSRLSKSAENTSNPCEAKLITRIKMTTDNDRNIHHHTGGKEQSGSTANKRTNAAHTYAKMT